MNKHCWIRNSGVFYLKIQFISNRLSDTVCTPQALGYHVDVNFIRIKKFNFMYHKYLVL